MTNRNQIKSHDDCYSATGFKRYLLVGDVLQSNSWKDLEERLSVKKNTDSIQSLFGEFKFLNYVTCIEHILCCFLALLNEKGKLVNREGVFKMIIDCVKRYRDLDIENAENLINEEIEDNLNRLINPHVVFYIAGMGLGNLINVLRNHTQAFERKEELVQKLTLFNDCRSNLVHHLLSSRINLNDEINIGLSSAAALKDLLDNLFENVRKIYPPVI
jgi:hypothetical protein